MPKACCLVHRMPKACCLVLGAAGYPLDVRNPDPTSTPTGTPDTSGTAPRPGERPDDTRRGPITVVLVNDYEIILQGLAAMLAPYSDRVQVVEMDIGCEPTRMADVALFDTFAGRRLAIERASEMVRHGRVKHVVLYTWDAASEFLQLADRAGVSGVVLKSVSGDVLVDVIERVMEGERIGLGNLHRGRQARGQQGLSAREEEVLALIALGKSNGEIGNELFLSVDTVKTYVRRLYAKLGVKNRAQAALCAAAHNVLPLHQVPSAGGMRQQPPPAQQPRPLQQQQPQQRQPQQQQPGAAPPPSTDQRESGDRAPVKVGG
jgi:DNA-binding NarL/FixJ family response regulator